MKKIVSVVMMFAVLLALTGCNSKKVCGTWVAQKNNSEGFYGEVWCSEVISVDESGTCQWSTYEESVNANNNDTDYGERVSNFYGSWYVKKGYFYFEGAGVTRAFKIGKNTLEPVDTGLWGTFYKE